jgi:hypothetical protein
MHLDLTPEALLTQLGYPANEQTLKQMNAIIANTEGFEKFSQHLPSFNDALAVEKAFIGLSNSENYLKIKCDTHSNVENLLAFHQLVDHWAQKYKMALKKVDNTETYYIIGHK